MLNLDAESWHSASALSIHAESTFAPQSLSTRLNAEDEVMLKTITADSFLQSDFRPMVDSRGQPYPYESWIALVKRTGTLPSSVPEPIANAFEICVGTIIYAWLYWPLLAIGFEKLLMLREMLARSACQKYGATESQTKNYVDCITYLVANGHISASQKEAWDIGRKMRNASAHPEKASLYLPWHAELMLETFVADATLLFPSSTT